MPPFQMTYEASGLNKDGKYEFWVTASTNIGEGQTSKSVILSPSSKGKLILIYCTIPSQHVLLFLFFFLCRYTYPKLTH